MSDFISFLKWWLVVSAIGWIAWPLAASAFRALPDRGLSLSRALGLLLGSYVFWLFGSLGFLANNASSIMLSLLVVLAISVRAGVNMGWAEPRRWLRENRRIVFAMEAVFFVAFAVWALVRAYNPQLMSAGGEKWMEYAFLNGINTSLTFPPHDPWLAGYAISYYYFGYVMIVALAKVTLVPLAIAFNLGIALLFALTALGAYGLVYNLMALAMQQKTQANRDLHPIADQSASEDAALEAEGANWVGSPTYSLSSRPENRHAIYLPALLGILLLLLIGNYEALLEASHSKGWGSEAIYAWFDVHDLDRQIPSGNFIPADSYWWWRASRTVNDRDPVSGNHVEVIDEFPFFSFLLGDMHPHVLALPFAFLAMGLGLSFHLRPEPARLNRLRLPVSPQRFLLAAAALGGLAFLNTWDFPIYLFLVTVAYLLGRVRTQGWNREAWLDSITLGLGLAGLGVLLYLPFYAGFQSQAGGIVPNLSFPTRLQQFFLMFGPLIFPLVFIMGYLVFWNRKGFRWQVFLGIALGAGVGLFLLSLLLGGLLLLLPGFLENVENLVAPLSTSAALQLSLRRRLIDSGTALVLGVLMAAAATLGLHWLDRTRDEAPPSLTFALLLVFTGGLLALGPEFFYLRDQFGSRINTVFKFYFQTWALWSVATAFGLWWVYGRLGKSAGRLAVVAITVLVVGMALVYPAMALSTKTNYFTANPYPTLDSTAEFAQDNPDDHAAIQWIKVNLNDQSIIAEAVGGSYTGFGRVSAFTGQPTVLGWPGHEGQWRGGYDEVGSRQTDIERLFRARDWAEAQPILDQYNIHYVYVGPLELTAYQPVSLSKFDQFMKEIYRASGVTIYERVDVPFSTTGR